MAEEIVAKYRVDVTEASKALTDLASKGAALETENKKVAKSFSAMGDEAVNAVGMVSPQIAAATGAFGTLKATTLAFITTLKTLRGALIATGLGAIAVIIGSIAAYFSSSEKAANKFKIVMASLGQVVETIGNIFEGLGETIVSIFESPEETLKGFAKSIKTYVTDQIKNVLDGVGLFGKAIKQVFAGDFDDAMKTSKEGALKLGEGLLKLNPATAVLIKLGESGKALAADVQVAVNAAIELQKATNALTESERALRVETGKRRADIKELQLLAVDETVSIADRIAAARKAAGIEDELLAKRLTNAAEAVRIAKEEMRLADDTADAKDKIAEAEVNLAGLREESAGKQRRLLSQIQAIEGQNAAKLKELFDSRQKSEAEAAEAATKRAEAELKEFTDLQNKKLALIQQYNELAEQLADELAITSNELLDRETQNIRNNTEIRKNIAFQAASEGQITAEQYSQAIIDIDAAEKAQLITAEEAHNARIFEMNKKRAEDEDDLRRQKIEEEEAMWNEIAAKVREYGAIAQQINSLISEAARVETEKELMALETALEAGQITREQYDQERRRLLSKQAADEKSAAIFAAIINTATAIADALPNIPLSIIAAALGAAQIAVIASQPIPKFAKGGYVDEKGMFVGKSHKQGGITIEAEGGEFITSKSKAQKYGHIVEAVNKGTIDKLIKDSYVTPAVNAALLNGFSDIGTSAQLNGLTAKLSDHNIIAAMDRNRQATTYGLAMIANEMRTGKRKNRRGYA